MSVVPMKLLTIAGPLERFDDVVRACDHLREAIASAMQDAQEILMLIEQARVLAAKKAYS